MDMTDFVKNKEIMDIATSVEEKHGVKFYGVEPGYALACELPNGKSLEIPDSETPEHFKKILQECLGKGPGVLSKHYKALPALDPDSVY